MDTTKTMSKENFLIITERNSWERETWSFFFTDTKLNRKSFEFAKKILKEDKSYSFKEQELSPEDIKQLKAYKRTSYLDTNNFMEGEYNFEKFVEKVPEDEKTDLFYKGQYAKFKVEKPDPHETVPRKRANS